MSGYAVNHCELYGDVNRSIGGEKFPDAVAKRAAAIASGIADGKRGKRARVEGVELVAVAAARAVLRLRGAVAAKRQKRVTTRLLAAVEVVARSIANHVIERGANAVAVDLDTDLDRLKSLAASTHISSC